MEYKLKFKEYNEALKEGRLLGLKCAGCGSIMVPPKMVCGRCAGQDFEIVQLKGAGRLRTFTTVFVASEGREAECPYTIVMVEMDEGPWVMGNLEGIDPKAASMELIGKKVTMGSKVFPGDKYSAGESARPVFTLAG